MCTVSRNWEHEKHFTLCRALELQYARHHFEHVPSTGLVNEITKNLVTSIALHAGSHGVTHTFCHKDSWIKVKVFCFTSTSERARMPPNTEPTVYWIHCTLMPGHEYPIPWVTAQKNLLPVGIEPGTSQAEVRLTNHLASRTGIWEYALYTHLLSSKSWSCGSLSDSIVS